MRWVIYEYTWDFEGGIAGEALSGTISNNTFLENNVYWTTTGSKKMTLEVTDLDTGQDYYYALDMNVSNEPCTLAGYQVVESVTDESCPPPALGAITVNYDEEVYGCFNYTIYKYDPNYIGLNQQNFAFFKTGPLYEDVTVELAAGYYKNSSTR